MIVSTGESMSLCNYTHIPKTTAKMGHCVQKGMFAFPTCNTVLGRHSTPPGMTAHGATAVDLAAGTMPQAFSAHPFGGSAVSMGRQGGPQRQTGDKELCGGCR